MNWAFISVGFSFSTTKILIPHVPGVPFGRLKKFFFTFDIDNIRNMQFLASLRPAGENKISLHSLKHRCFLGNINAITHKPFEILFT